MQIITDDYILLSHNIESIYTNLEKFIEAVDRAIEDGLLVTSPKTQAELNNFLAIQASNENSVFIGIFFNIDPLGYEVQIHWWLLQNSEEYGAFLQAMEQNLTFDISSRDRLKPTGYDADRLAVYTGEEDFAEPEEDEYDLDLDLDDINFMDNDEDV